MKTTFPARSKPFEENIREIAEIIVSAAKDKIAFVILFGSFARGTWVEDRYGEDNAVYEYSSDYDFLVIKKAKKKDSKEEGISDSALKRKIEQEIELKTIVRDSHDSHFVIEPIDYINSELEKGRYFFSDIKKEGILLYNSGEFKLAEPKVLTAAEIKEMAREDWKHWSQRAKEFSEFCNFAFKKEYFNGAAFNLHQTAESLYNCALLTLTGYKPKTHDLKKLNKLCATHSNEFLNIFPINKIKKSKSTHRNLTKTQIEKLYDSNKKEDAFELLQRSYIDARYNKHFKIAKWQLEYLVERVEVLKAVVARVCKDKI